MVVGSLTVYVWFFTGFNKFQQKRKQILIILCKVRPLAQFHFSKFCQDFMRN